MKKITLFLLLLFSSLFFNGIPETNAENSNSNSDMKAVLDEERDKYIQMYQEIYQKSLIMQIEFESEIIIPDYFDFKYVEYTYNTANQLGVPTRMAFRLMFKESSFRDSVKSPVGAQGLMQLMPETRVLYRDIIRTDTLNLDRNQEDIYIGLYMVKDLYGYWTSRGNSEKYSWRLSLASYNAGKGTVQYYKGIPPIKETTDFLAFILKAHSNPQFYANILKKNDNTHKDRS